MTCREVFWENAAQGCEITQPYLFNMLLHCVGLLFTDYCCLINKRTFSYHFLHAWALVPRLLSVSLALPPASVVLE